MDTTEKNFEATVEAALLRDPLASDESNNILVADTPTNPSSGGYRRREPGDYEMRLVLVRGREDRSETCGQDRRSISQGLGRSDRRQHDAPHDPELALSRLAAHLHGVADVFADRVQGHRSQGYLFPTTRRPPGDDFGSDRAPQ